MKVYKSKSRVLEVAEFHLDELDTNIHDLMMDHVEKNEIIEADLLSIAYGKIAQIGEIIQIYKDSLNRNE